MLVFSHVLEELDEQAIISSSANTADEVYMYFLRDRPLMTRVREGSKISKNGRHHLWWTIGLQNASPFFSIFRNLNKLYIIGNGDSLEDYVFISIGQLPDYWPF